MAISTIKQVQKTPVNTAFNGWEHLVVLHSRQITLIMIMIGGKFRLLTLPMIVKKFTLTTKASILFSYVTNTTRALANHVDIGFDRP